MGQRTPPRGPAWATAAELGEYAFCPRAWHYRAHPPASAPSSEDLERERYGLEFHARALSREQSREHSSPGIAGLGVLLFLAGALLLLYLLGVV
ncbi:MAG: hypothetical protein L3K13_00710 [Thermoplasmata archaeon]|nr:hypothetical protein [Thermoplasmata archaeon]